MSHSAQLLVVSVALLAGCGTDGLVSDRDPGLEPPAGTDAYDPSDGQGEGGGGYYTTTGQVSAGPSGPDTADAGDDSSSSAEGSSGAAVECGEKARLCGHNFTLTDAGFTAVDVMGDFSADGWESGVPMTLEDGTWSASIDLAWALDTEYRFRLDGGDDWILDPANADSENDNSVVRALMCDPYICP